ncbi:iron-dependent peroxidase [Paenibacillus chitinolyticus]|uniref:iron-dependent peroxidase n=1 Tax=Paenibacillus chitinolyticus TaxID=79263 RepID=UPI002DB7ED16|nr:iron-dependent peroxidase [Paenibacillus chitinolyticus]MEC0245983.1 iron-dependent peroxidase [Paenibacillus chitinolyticus]
MGLNYIWDLLIRAEQCGLDKKDIQFSAASVYSPYMELSLEHMNASQVEKQVEINPFYRFDEMFRGMLDINYTEYPEFRRALFDILIHFLGEIDLLQGMNKREFYIRFVRRDIEAGIFGDKVRRNFQSCGKEEQDIVAASVLQTVQTGDALFTLKRTARLLFPGSTIYANCEEKNELLFYINQEESESGRAKISLLLDLLLPVRFHTELYWNRHFGILGVEETMRLDRIAMY